jgi:tRNA dimethylallyltransferase
LAKYQKLAFKAIADVLRRGKLPIIVGGTGLYIQALVDNLKLSSVKPDLKKRALLEKLSAPELFEKLIKLKPEFAAHLNNSDKNNKRRLVRYIEVVSTSGFEKTGRQNSPYNFLVLGLDFSDEIIKDRIIKRIKERLDNEDMVQEVEDLHKSGLAWERLESFGLEYKFISQYLQEKFDHEIMVDKLSTASYRFAKRQKTWFRRWQKQGQKINWIKDLAAARKLISLFLK